MFRFKLDFLLRYRRQKEEEAMYELARRIRETNDIRSNLERLKMRSGELAADVLERAAAPVPAPVYKMYKDYLGYLRRKKENTLASLAQAETEVEEQRRRLIQASVDRKIIDRFKEIQHEAYLEAEARREQNNLDELAALGASRRVNED